MTGSATPGGLAVTASSTNSFLLPVNGLPNLSIPNTSCPGDTSAPGSPCVVNDYPTTLNYGRTEQATTMTDAEALLTNGAGHQIGLSGSLLLASPATTGILTPYDFRLTKTNTGVWNISTYDTAFGYSNFLKLTDVSQSLDLNGQCC